MPEAHGRTASRMTHAGPRKLAELQYTMAIVGGYSLSLWQVLLAEDVSTQTADAVCQGEVYKALLRPSPPRDEVQVDDVMW